MPVNNAGLPQPSRRLPRNRPYVLSAAHGVLLTGVISQDGTYFMPEDFTKGLISENRVLKQMSTTGRDGEQNVNPEWERKLWKKQLQKSRALRAVTTEEVREQLALSVPRAEGSHKRGFLASVSGDDVHGIGGPFRQNPVSGSLARKDEIEGYGMMMNMAAFEGFTKKDLRDVLDGGEALTDEMREEWVEQTCSSVHQEWLDEKQALKHKDRVLEDAAMGQLYGPDALHAHHFPAQKIIKTLPTTPGGIDQDTIRDERTLAAASLYQMFLNLKTCIAHGKADWFFPGDTRTKKTVADPMTLHKCIPGAFFENGRLRPAWAALKRPMSCPWLLWQWLVEAEIPDNVAEEALQWTKDGPSTTWMMRWAKADGLIRALKRAELSGPTKVNFAKKVECAPALEAKRKSRGHKIGEDDLDPDDTFSDMDVDETSGSEEDAVDTNDEDADSEDTNMMNESS